MSKHTSMIEREVKITLSLEKFNSLLKERHCLQTITQENHYFDSPNFSLNEQGITIKIRKIDNKHILYLKNKLPERSFEITTKEEISIKLDLNYLPTELTGNYLLTVIPKNTKLYKKMHFFKNQKFFNLGVLCTTRYFNKTSNFEICLDKNDYLNTTDYELEIELLNSRDDLTAIFKSLNLQNVNYSSSKFDRFLIAYKENFLYNSIDYDRGD